MKAQKIKVIKSLINPKPKEVFELPAIVLTVRGTNERMYIGSDEQIKELKKQYGDE